MYSFCLAVQYLGILVLVIEILYILRQKSSKLQVLMLTVMVSTLINFVGYLFEMRAVTQEMALQAVKFIYLGKPYIILGIFLFILQYYKVKCPAWVKAFLCGFHVSLTFLVMECERQNWYYSSITYTQDGMFPHLVLGKGIVYFLFSVLIVIYLIVILVLGVLHYRKTSDWLEKKRILCLSGCSLIAAAGLAIYFSGITGGYDSTLPAYVVCTILLLISMMRYNLLDTMDLVRESVTEDFTEGLLVLDQDGKLIYYNPVLQRIYPDLGAENYRDVLEEMEEYYREGGQFSKGDEIYQIEEKEILRGDVNYGKMYLVKDITESFRYTIQLEKQTVIAQQANRAKSDFLARMSHEIRTPINSVLGMNEMILRESGEETIREYAANVKASANALLSIINDILDLSKIESGKLEILPVEYELGSLLNDVVHMIYLRARDKGLALEVQVQETLPSRLYGDDVRIRQILTNLLTNAVKYTPKGGIALRVSGKTEGKKALISCEVEDTGIGIRKEDLPKLYESFERIEENRNRGIEGTGLGINIVSDLLCLMGSRLRVDSVYGEGSKFWFELEQEIVDAQPIGDFQERSSRMESEQQYDALFTAPDAKVLVVDDNDVNRSVFRHLLKKTKVQIRDVSSGQECLDLLQKEAFDLIFLDHMMPGMDGVETLHRLKDLPGNLSAGVPVIVLTANAVTGARETYLEEGFDDFLSKPILPEKLEKMLKTYLPQNMVSEQEAAGEKPFAAKAPKEDGELLPELEEFQYHIARMNLGDDALIRQTMLHIYYTMDEEMETLERLAGEIAQKRGEALGEYRIHVHSLKSTAATVGAMLLSQLARLSEVAAIEGNTEKLLTLHPILIEEMAKHRERLKVLDSGGEQRKQAEPEKLAKLLEALAEALDQRDYDAADERMEALGAYEYPEKYREKVETLRLQVLNLEADNAIETIKSLEKEWRSS